MRKRFAAALLGGFFILTGPALAEPVCGPRDTVAGLLQAEFGERPVAEAVTAWGRHLVLFAAPDGASWSIAVTDPQGTTCLIAAGVGWQGRSQPQPGTEAR